ncbi:hypothetical protein [Kitasatospora sp. NPDC057223]|uniref:hypothetical protein n=1 Tax=Kitasatospora sp. NPDC057223 TaxID=3346055 RepID=UPI003641A065
MDFFKLNEDYSEIVHVGTSAFATRDWPQLSGAEYRFISFQDLVTGEFKVVWWCPPDLINLVAYHDACKTMIEFTDAAAVPRIDQCDLDELNRLTGITFRETLQSGVRLNRLFRTAELADLLEFQPSELTEDIPDRRHRRFCNLMWVQQDDGTFTLKHGYVGDEFNAQGEMVSWGTGDNTAPHTYEGGADSVAGMHMHPDGGGLVLPEPDWAAIWADLTAEWDARPQEPQQRVWQTDMSTDRSERNYHKVNARARLELKRPGKDSRQWTVSINIGADIFYWAGAGFLGSWQRDGHNGSFGAAIYTRADWNRKWATTATPVATAGARRWSDGSGGGECTFSTGLDVDSGEYVCTWWYVRHAPDTGTRFQQDQVTVNGDIVFHTAGE